LEEVNTAVRGEEKRAVETSQRPRGPRKSIECQQEKDGRQKKHAQRGNGSKVMAMEWLGNRWKRFVFDMAGYVIEMDEEEMRARCEVELDAWRDYCEETKNLSFQEMVMKTRIALRTSIPAPQNEWWNPETEEWEHIGLKYLNCSEVEWEQMRISWLDRRVLLPDPEQIVSRAIGMLSTGLMDAEAWPQLVVGIAVLTGQGLLRILKNGRFSQKTAFSLLFRDAVHYNPFFRDPFEIPTLGRADLVVEAWERVREIVDCAQIDEQELLHQYGQRVREVASKSFRDLVPLPAGATDVFTVLHHIVYPCLATHYYCPPSVESVEYLAKICNEPVLLADPSPGARFACAAVRNYLEYRLADEQKGIWLGRPDSTVIPVNSATREEEMRSDHAVVKMVFDEDDLCLLNDVRCQMGFEFVYVALREEMLSGLKLQRPFRVMLSSELKMCNHPRAIYELSRRTIVAVIRYNQSLSDSTLRWYLNETAIFQVIQKERYFIRWCLEDYQEEIDRHHQQFNLTADGNVKAVPITEVILLPDDPQFFEGESMCG